MPRRENLQVDAFVDLVTARRWYQRAGAVAGGGRRGAGAGSGAAGSSALGCMIGLGCRTEAGCCTGAVDDIFCLMSSSTACNAAMVWAIWSCLAASCSRLRRTTSILDARGASCSAGAGDVAAMSADGVVERGNNSASPGASAASMALRSEEHTSELQSRENL